MDVRLSNKVAEEIGFKLFKPFLHGDESAWSWKCDTEISLAAMSGKQLDQFEKIFIDHQHVKGTAIILKDIHVWKAALVDRGDPKVRAVRNLKALMVRAIGNIAGRRLYKKFD